ncbi:hypothetical protein ACWDTQ_28215 [Streptomyces cellulosae]
MAESGYSPAAWIADEIERSEEERADRDRFMAERIDIWKIARKLLFDNGDFSPSAEDIVNTAEFIAGDRIGGA